MKDSTLSLNPNAYGDFYKTLWALFIPTKIKIHVWRSMNDLLPHFTNLMRRTLRIEAVCPLCKAGLEDSDHLLWSCSILQSVWDSLQIKPPVFEEQLCGKQRFVSTFSSANNQQKCVMIISIWSLWYRRNKLVHEGLSFQELIGFIKGYVQELSLSQERLERSEYFRDRIARDSSGEIIGLETYLFTDVCDACVAEARACERALRFASVKGYHRIAVEGDSLTVIKHIKNKNKDRSVLRALIYQIRSLEESSHAFDGRSTATVLWGLVWEYTGICEVFGHERPDGMVSSVRFCLVFALNSVMNHRMSVLDSKLHISSHLLGFNHKGEVERFDG
ncbi:hypothetical protein J1N35_030436 [Gossypium stocksii]|uniref:Reverse transcriptase zinc-binding domain-containing protein n=1 Tax=Gossypium stocksii TaxID=47602 RepID=A0A9D3V205_9ROSI|nr:hypothetical protein J1N35_030436 [Gossypium stocksii]